MPGVVSASPLGTASEFPIVGDYVAGQRSRRPLSRRRSEDNRSEKPLTFLTGYGLMSDRFSQKSLLVKRRQS